MAEMKESMAFEKIEKFAMLMAFVQMEQKNVELFEMGENHVHIKMRDEEGDKYEFTFTANGD